MATQPNKRHVLTAANPKPPGAPVLNFNGPFVAEAGGDVEYSCARCGTIIIAMPDNIHLRTETGPVVIACWKCRTENIAP
jgi:DNA-directed RNA polymerase subunit RPC12/RpoP